MIPKDKIHRLASASVRDRDGASVGKVTQVFPADDGHAEYVAVRTGLLGSESLVPVDDASFDGMDLHVGFTKSTISDAPSLGRDRTVSPTEANAVRAHYGLSHAGAATGDMGDPGENLEPTPAEASDDTEGAGTASNA